MPLKFDGLLKQPYAAYGCEPFGDDTSGNYIWDNLESSRDLIKGDGSTASTFPTFVSDTAGGIAYYTFDGVDDYVGNWPDLTGDYTISACFSTSYPDGVPFVTQCSDSTVKDLLTVGGTFTGNLHSLVILDYALSDIELYQLEWQQLNILRQETVVRPFHSRLIRDSSVQCYEFWYPASPLIDYSDVNAIATPTGITWDNGITFDGASSVITVSDVAALRSDTVSIFLSGNFVTAASTLIQKGVNYDLSLLYDGGNIAIDFNGAQSGSVPSAGVTSVAVTCADGEEPIFYANGESIGESIDTAVLDDTDTDDLLIGNDSVGGEQVSGNITSLVISNEILTDAEIRALHQESNLYAVVNYPQDGSGLPIIIDVDGDDEITTTQTDVVVSCKNAGNSAGKILLSNSPVINEASVVVEQTIKSWSDNSIEFDVVLGYLMSFPKLIVVGDSTAAYFDPATYYPMTGWASVLQTYIHPSLTISNQAVSSQSSKSYYDILWTGVKGLIRPIDYVLIQFGHNDSLSDPAKYTEPWSTYQDYLSLFVDETRDRGATPILATSISSSIWVGGVLQPTVGDYPAAMIALAGEKNVPCVDMNGLTFDHFSSVGEATTDGYFMVFGPGTWPLWPAGSNDHVHLQNSGALVVANIFAQNIPSFLESHVI